MTAADPDATGSRAATACKDCGSTENVHTHCAGTLPLCPDCLPNHVEPTRATPDRAAVSWEDVKMLLYEAGYRETQPGVFSRETDGRQLIVVPKDDDD